MNLNLLYIPNLKIELKIQFWLQIIRYVSYYWFES